MIDPIFTKLATMMQFCITYAAEVTLTLKVQSVNICILIVIHYDFTSIVNTEDLCKEI